MIVESLGRRSFLCARPRVDHFSPGDGRPREVRKLRIPALVEVGRCARGFRESFEQNPVDRAYYCTYLADACSRRIPRTTVFSLTVHIGGLGIVMESNKKRQVGTSLRHKKHGIPPPSLIPDDFSCLPFPLRISSATRNLDRTSISTRSVREMLLCLRESQLGRNFTNSRNGKVRSPGPSSVGRNGERNLSHLFCDVEKLAARSR